jgi:hypothetical protein
MAIEGGETRSVKANKIDVNFVCLVNVIVRLSFIIFVGTAHENKGTLKTKVIR